MKIGFSYCIAFAAATSTALPMGAFAACDVKSGPQSAALVELYTSEGCSSCPPADQQLRQIRAAAGPGADVVPLSLHVDYWDYIGWKDPFAKAGFAARQAELAARNGQGIVYTPQFFVDGAELGGWRGRLGTEIRRANARPARADIEVKTALTASRTLVVEAKATARSPGAAANLYLAVTESGLSTHVARGENAGATLDHDHVVREWIGPLPLQNGSAGTRQEIALPAAWNTAHLVVVAFVEDAKTAAVLQTVSTRSCSAS